MKIIQNWPFKESKTLYIVEDWQRGPHLQQETKLSKRVSHLFFGHLSTTCACGEGGSALSLPHDCATMQSAMLR